MNSASSSESGSDLALALTMGEPAGVGGEVTLKAWMAKKRLPFLSLMMQIVYNFYLKSLDLMFP